LDLKLSFILWRAFRHTGHATWAASFVNVSTDNDDDDNDGGSDTMNTS